MHMCLYACLSAVARSFSSNYCSLPTLALVITPCIILRPFFCLSLLLFTFSFYSSSRGDYYCIMSAAGFYLLVLTVFSAMLAWNIFGECGFLFCWNTKDHTYLPYDPPKPEAGLGWIGTVGIGAFAINVSLLIVYIVSFINHWCYADFHHQPVVGIAQVNDGTTNSDYTNPAHPGNGMVDQGKTAPLMGDHQASDGSSSSEGDSVEIVHAPSTRRRAYNTDMHIRQVTETTAPRDPQALPVVTAMNVTPSSWVWLWYFLYALFIVTCWFISGYIPNNWEYFTSNRVANKAQLKVTNDKAKCAEWRVFTCPEYEGAAFVTIMWEITDTFNIKFYPDNAFFYTLLLAVPFFALLIRQLHLDHVFDRKVSVSDYNLWEVLSYLWYSLCGLCCNVKRVTVTKRMAYFSYKEIAVCIGVLITGVLFFYYWAVDHNYNGYWPNEKIRASESLARSFGMLSVFFLSLLMFPAARNSPLYSLLGVSWEASITYHRWLGSLFLISVFLHMVINWYWYWEAGHFPDDIISVPMTLDISIDNFTTPLATIVTWFMFLGIGTFAFYEPFRRRSFEWFWYLHQISYFVLIPTVIWHATNGWHFMLPSMLIFLVDRSIRAYRSSKAVHLLDARLTVSGHEQTATTARVATGAAVDYGAAGAIVHLRVAGGNMTYLPGQYAFINIAELSLLEWHPFTISSPVHPKARDEVTFHIKDMGPSTWTGRLYQHVKENNSITVSLDGPYGHPIDFRKYSTVLLVGGGIGLTPVKSIFESMRLSYAHDDPALVDDLQLDSPDIVTEGPFSPASGTDILGPRSRMPKRVHLLLVGRDISLFDTMRDSLQDLPSGPFSARLHVDVPPTPASDSTTSAPILQSELKASSSDLGSPIKPVPGHLSIGGTQPGNMSPGRVPLGSLLVRARPDFEQSLAPVAQRIDGFADPAYFSLPSQPGPGIPPGVVDISGYQQSLSAEVEQLYGPLPPPGETILFVCGPAPVSAACEALAHKMGWAFHTETFAL